MASLNFMFVSNLQNEAHMSAGEKLNQENLVLITLVCLKLWSAINFLGHFQKKLDLFHVTGLVAFYNL